MATLRVRPPWTDGGGWVRTWLMTVVTVLIVVVGAGLLVVLALGGQVGTGP